MAAAKRQKKGPQPWWSQIFRRVNVLFRRTSRREVLTFLLFVAFAGGFWYERTGREEAVKDYIILLNIEDQPQDMVFTTHVPAVLKVTLVDTNYRLSKYSYSRNINALTVDFERYADAMGNFRISAAELQSLLREQLQSTTQIRAISPSLIDARFAQTEGRKFAVRLRSHYFAFDNYRIRPVLIEPDSVTINAPASVLDTLKYVWTMPHPHNELLKDTLTETMMLELPIGVKATPNRVKVTVPVSQYVEKVFGQKEVSTTDVPAGKQLVVFPYGVKLTCLVDFDYYRKLQEEDFDVEVSYDSIASHGKSGRLPISVRYKGENPEVVTNIRIEPQQAEYVVEQATQNTWEE